MPRPEKLSRQGASSPTSPIRAVLLPVLSLCVFSGVVPPVRADARRITPRAVPQASMDPRPVNCPLSMGRTFASHVSPQPKGCRKQGLLRLFRTIRASSGLARNMGSTGRTATASECSFTTQEIRTASAESSSAPCSKIARAHSGSDPASSSIDSNQRLRRLHTTRFSS